MTLYAPLDWAMVRAPLLPATPPAPAPAAAGLLPADARVRAALAVASPDLLAAAARTGPDDPKADRVRRALLRYRIRMSTRPTPYGLFSGVGLAHWSPTTTLALADAQPRTRTRPDMGWLTDLVERLTDDPDVRPGLRYAVDSAVLVQGGRVHLGAGPGRPVSLRATDAVRCVLAAARTPTPLPALAAELTRTLGATPAEADGVLADLRRAGVLSPELRPSPTGGDPLAHVAARLAGIPAAAPTAAGLTELGELLADWDHRPLADRTGWPDLLARARTVHRAGADVLQTDMALPLAGAGLHEAVGAEAARAAELLLRLGPLPSGRPELAAYRRAFEDRYGPEREVPLLELLDPDFGLGPPPEPEPTRPADPELRRDQLLTRLALDAGRDGTAVLELDDALLARLQRWDPDPAAAPATADLPVLVAARSAAALDAGEFLLVVGPNVGPVAAGSNLGRFADLLGTDGLAALRSAAAAEAVAAPGLAGAEVVYPPGEARAANVALRPAVRPYELVVGGVPGTAARSVPVAEIVVGVRGGRLVARWPAGGVDLLCAQAHMLSPLGAPPVVRFLLDLAGDRGCQLAPFDWGTAARFPYLPRVQRGRIVLAPARWRVDAFPELSGDDAALAGWRRRWHVPRDVQLTSGDQRLLLDLDDPAHRDLLRAELRRPADRRPTLLQEALPGRADAWLPGPDGGRIAELVVPLALRVPPPARPAPRPPGPVPAALRTRLPGSDWLYLKLYVPEPLEDELIAGGLRSFGAFATGAGLAAGWFFLRYGDPRRHLRVRFHGDPAALSGPLLREALRWADGLVAAGICTDVAIDTYQREVERYGGAAGVAVAERLAMADSAAVAELLHGWRPGGTPTDRLALAVLGLRDLLDAVELDPAGWRDVLGGQPPSTSDGQEYRRRKDELRRLLGPDGLADAGPVAAVLAHRRAGLAAAGAELVRLDRAGRLERPRAEIARVLAHLHVNRLVGTEPADEQRVLELLRRTREALRHAPAPTDLPHP